MSDIHLMRIEGKDKDGNYDEATVLGEGLRTCSQDYLQAIAESDIAGHTPFSKYGRCTVSNSEIDVVTWNAAYTFPSTAAKVRIVSDSAQDGVGGTGALKIKIEYLDADYATQTEEVTMNGTTPVTSSASMLRINRVYISSAGTGLKAAGTINVYHLSNATPIYGQISPNNTQSRQLIYTVPAGKTLYITSVRYSTGVGNTTSSGKFNFVIFTNRANVDPASGAKSTYFYPFNEIGLVNGAFILPLEMPTKIPEKCDLKISVLGDTNLSVTATAALRGWLE